ncbi:MAG: hypothetical protein ABIG63_00485, partial [Chloroflexota bacterium]
QQILENEKDDFTNRFEGQLAEQGNSMNLYMQTRGIDEETLDKEITLAAETQLKQKLVLIELAEVEDLQIDLEQLDAKLKGTISVATKNLSSKDAKKYTTKEFVSALSARITEEMLIEKAAEYLRAITKGELIPEESGEPEDAGGEAQPEDDTQPEETSQESVSTSETEVIVLEGENPPESKVNP